MAYDYCGFRVGDVVQRMRGHWRDHSTGSLGVVIGLENGHLRFHSERGDTFGASPAAYMLVSKSPVDVLFDKRAQDKLMTNH